MDVLLCWGIAPAGLLLVTVGLSLLTERLTRFAVPWTIRPALGMAVAIVVAQFGTATSTTADLTVPTILVLAIVGLLIGGSTAARRPERAEMAVGIVVFLLFASPFLVIGEATWAGFIKLDDTATWMALADHVFDQGRGIGDFPPSTHHQVIIDYLGGDYPIGGFVPAALMATIASQDVAFTMQPSMAFAAAALALGLFEMVRRPVRGGGVASAIAVFGSMSSLLIAYYLWGGVKELVIVALLPLVPLLGALVARTDRPNLGWAPLALAITATLVVLGPGGAVWALPALAPAGVLLWRTDGSAAFWRLTWRAATFTLILSLPLIFTPSGLFDPLIDSSLTEASELGNLFQPLNFLQVVGIWPSIDFRTDPQLEPAVLLLCGLCIAIALATVAFLARTFDAENLSLVGYAAGGIAGAAAMSWVGSPWVDAKAMAMLSPATLTLALLGIVLLGQRTGFRFEAAVLGVVVPAAVLWSAFLSYQGVWFAPRGPHVELEDIGEIFAGQGPALSTEAAIYGPRHFLRKLDAEGASDRRTRPVLLTDGTEPEKGQTVDLDEVQVSQLDPYKLVVVRRSPTASRPPASFVLAYRSPRYDVWRKGTSPGVLLDHLSLGTPLDAGDVPACADLREMAQETGPRGKLIAARVGMPVAIGLAEAQRPAGWGAPTAYTLSGTGAGNIAQEFEVPGGSYELWLGGVIFGTLDLFIDEAKVATVSAALGNPGAMEPLGTVRLAPGRHLLELDYSGASLLPGSALDPYEIGPLELAAPVNRDLGTVTAGSQDYRRLCGRRWDWVEAYR